ncbi:unnamed protein product [Owenia fusiformis]|uniref:Fibrinogen C-terminal domain-containing protein n=1 Tax=Owenia fusiformis TaxID=6347 RepID=A0A8S4Q433_OWEFU|nr:unnamed protein product [Owenia fusiformis]
MSRLGVLILLVGVFIKLIVCQAPPRGVHFLGKGYNQVTGNPEGDPGKFGGVDPGIQDTRSIIQLTYARNKLTSDLRYKVPDQVFYGPRESCTESAVLSVVYSSESYQRGLKESVETSYSGGFMKGVLEVSFSASQRFAEMKKHTSDEKKVFFQSKNECLYGTARLRLESARSEKFKVTKSFRDAICSLPLHDTNAFMRFIDTWGTDFIDLVKLGSKETNRSEESETSFLEDVSKEVGGGFSAGGSYKLHSGSLKVDMESIRTSLISRKAQSHNRKTLKSGTKDNPEPIHLRLTSIHGVLTDNYFEGMKCPGISSMFPVAEKMKTALMGYPIWKKLSKPTGRIIRLPVAWPRGTYGLPKTNTGCPNDGTWHSGWRKHDTETNNWWSHPLHFPVNSYWKNDIYQHFCTKTDTTGYSNWPEGEYCIYKSKKCPEDFEEGWIKWDDEDSNNKNMNGGYRPDMVATRDTIIFYCCRNDGHATNGIDLPMTSPFYLFPIKDYCQKVNGMKSTLEYFRFDCEDSSNKNRVGGLVPYHGTSNRDHTIHYCYYTRDLPVIQDCGADPSYIGARTIKTKDGRSFNAYCEMGWTYFSQRFDGTVNFFRNWAEYKNGFGNAKAEHFVGLDNIVSLLKQGNYKLRIDLIAWFTKTHKYAEYTTFRVADGSDKYRLTIGGYSGTAGDSMSGHNNMRFSTHDQDNDAWPFGNCAATYTGAWWYNSCHFSNLFGVYNRHPVCPRFAQCIAWYKWPGNLVAGRDNYWYSFPIFTMKIIRK